jgi:hypothetical protein
VVKALSAKHCSFLFYWVCFIHDFLQSLKGGGVADLL